MNELFLINPAVNLQGKGREHQLDKARPWRAPYESLSEGNGWMGERVNAYADEIMTGTPRQSVTTHESNSYLNFPSSQAGSSHTLSPRMPISAPPGISGNAAANSSLSFLSDYGSAALSGTSSSVVLGSSSLFGDHSSTSFFSHNSTSHLPPSYPASARDLILDDSLGNQNSSNSSSSSRSDAFSLFRDEMLNLGNLE